MQIFFFLMCFHRRFPPYLTNVLRHTLHHKMQFRYLLISHNALDPTPDDTVKYNRYVNITFYL